MSTDQLFRSLERRLNDNLEKTSEALDEVNIPDLIEISKELYIKMVNGGIVYTLGCGGSAAHAQHLAAELVGNFKFQRRPLGAIALSANPAILTAISNDFGEEFIYSQQVAAMVTSSDVLIAFSTSGKSPSVLKAVEAATQIGALVIGISGEPGNPLDRKADYSLPVYAEEVFTIQEIHQVYIHMLCYCIDVLEVRK